MQHKNGSVKPTSVNFMNENVGTVWFLSLNWMELCGLICLWMSQKSELVKSNVKLTYYIIVTPMDCLCLFFSPCALCDLVSPLFQ